MKIVFLASGTLGDILPYVALGKALQQRGYSICIGGPSNYAEYVESHGLEYAPIMGDIHQFLNRAEVMSQMKASNPIKFIRGFRELSKAFRGDLEAMFHEALVVSQEADLLVYHPGLMNAYFYAEKLGIPCVMASPFPLSSTAHFPSMVFYNGPRLGGLYNRLTHWFLQIAFWQGVKAAVVSFWKKHSKPLPFRLENPLKPIHRRRLPVLYGISRHVVPPPPDWHDAIGVTGYWFPPEQDYTPPQELSEFLSAGEKPVYVGFGSIVSVESHKSLQLCIQALKQLGKRVVLSSKSPDEDWKSDPDLFHLESAPHTWLFPRMEAVIHHGGAGTTAAGFLAGVPSLIVPFSNDQPMWARKAVELGVGETFKPSRKHSVSAITTLLQRLLSEETKQHAALLGQKIQAEDGVQEAVERIEAVLKQRLF